MILETLQESGLIERFKIDLTERVDLLRERVRDAAEQAYLGKSKELFSAPGVNCAAPLLFMTDTIEKNIKLLDKRFPSPLLGHVDIVALVTEVQVPMHLGDLEANRRRLYESSMNEPTPDVPIEDLFHLYRRSKTLMDMLDAFCPKFVFLSRHVFAKLTSRPIILQFSDQFRSMLFLRALRPPMAY